MWTMSRIESIRRLKPRLKMDTVQQIIIPKDGLVSSNHTKSNYNYILKQSSTLCQMYKYIPPVDNFPLTFDFTW